MAKIVTEVHKDGDASAMCWHCYTHWDGKSSRSSAARHTAKTGHITSYTKEHETVTTFRLVEEALDAE